MASRGTTLFRAILREHRRTLPAEMRQLGDKYVKDEFRRHTVAEPAFLERFFAEWDHYLATLQQQNAATGFGSSLDETKKHALNDEQKQMLGKLKREAAEAFNQNG